MTLTVIAVLFLCLGKGVVYLSKKLTIKQKKFADEYIKTGNATQSAINAGYSKKTAGQVGEPPLFIYIEKTLLLLLIYSFRGSFDYKCFGGLVDRLKDL